MRKKTSILKIAIPVLVITLILMYTAGLLKIPTFAITPIVESGKTGTNVAYTCPATKSECVVSGTMNCDVSQGTKRVIFRSASTEWSTNPDFALAISSTSGLQSFTYNTQISNSKCGVNNNYLFSNNGAEVHYSSSDGVYICYVRSSSVLARSYKIGGNADTSPLVKSPLYNEVYSDGSGYNCQGTFKIESSSGVLKKSEDLTYKNPNTKGSDSSISYTIIPGDKASVLGGSSNYISWTSIFTPECEFNFCSSKSGENGWYNCTNGRKTLLFNSCGLGYQCEGGITNQASCILIPTCSIAYCNDGKTGVYQCTPTGQQGTFTLCDTNKGYTCKDSPSGASCQPPFKTISLTTSKPGYSINESVIVNVNLFSEDTSINTGTVTVYVWDSIDSTTPIGTYPINNYNFKSNQVVNVPISNPKIPNKYYITMKVNYNGKTLSLEPKPSFNIAPVVSCTLEIRGKNRPTAYVNNPVTVSIVTPIQVDKRNLNVVFNSYPIYDIPTPTETRSGDFIFYTYEFLFATPGTLEVIASVEKSGVKSASVSARADVKNLVINTAFTNLVDCVTPGTSKTLTFETMILDNLEDTENTLKVRTPTEISLKDISSLITRVGKGKYQFTYTFTEKGGYDLDLTSRSSEFNVVGNKPILNALEVRDNCDPVECVSSQDCASKGTGYYCSNNKCVPNDNPLPPYLLYIGFAIIVIIIIIIIIVFLKRPKQDIYTGIGGL